MSITAFGAVGSVSRLRHNVAMSLSPVSAPMIGRESELATLRRLAGVDGGPRPGLVLLHGDAGMGKSRLLSALGEAANDSGWRVAAGHCLDLGGSPMAYLPFSELAAQLDVLRPARMAQLAERWPDLRRLLAHQPGAEQPPEALDRGRFFGSLHAVLSELGRESPVLLMIEDVHWADQSTCDLLSFLFSRGFTEPVSLVVTYRSDDLHRRHPLRTIAAGWSRLPAVSRLELPPLPDEQVRQLVQALGPGSVTEVEMQTIVERAEGNAFFTEELVAAVGSRSVPKDLAGLLLLRVDQLEPDARTVVRAASAGGRLVSDIVLAKVSGLVGARFEAAIRTAVELNVLVPEDDSYRFRHSMLAEAVYDDLLPGERRRVHAAYVSALTDAASSASAAELARHAIAAEDHATAYAASVRAGDDATAVGGPDEAARHYAMALDLLGSRPDESSFGSLGEAVELTEKAALAAVHAGHVQRAEAIVAEQVAQLPAKAPAQERARLLIALAEAAALSESSTDVIAVTAEALALVPPEPLTQLRSRAVAAHAMALGGARRDSEAVRWAEEGLAMPPEVRVGEVTIQLQTLLARIVERGGDAVASRRILEELAAATEGTTDPSEVRVLHQLAGIYLEQGELAEALDTYRRAARQSAEVGRPFAPYGVDSRILAGLVAHQLGRWDLALEIVDLGAEEVPSLAAAGLLSVTLTVRAGRGESSGWQQLMARIRPEWSADGMVAVHSAAAAIDLTGSAADVDATLAVFDELLASVEQTWGTADFQARIRLTALLLGQLAGLVSDLDDDRRSALMARVAELPGPARCATGLGRRPSLGLESQAWLQRLSAELLRLQAAAGESVDPAEQVTAWQAAVDGFRRYGHVFEQARSEARLAAALRAAGQAAQSVEVAQSALRTAEQLRAAPLVAELRPLVGTARTPGTSTVEVLTPREREVLVLVAEGRTNPEIGHGLFISTKTASVHVSNILAKLKAKTRTEAVSIARRRGLLDRPG